ncbi:alpha/beta hydrolase fold domain-containing protein [Streptomyces sp. NPDC014733]|uniref:alpha/beta hydrolase fold domain-containing protein n=1 Tax=Streptomyces sp. NPDC014733 TaxID=3364885 RepID=UPI0036FBAC55
MEERDDSGGRPHALASAGVRVPDDDRACRSPGDRTRAVALEVPFRSTREGSPCPPTPNSRAAALTWIAGNPAELGADPTRIAVAGGSVGGNIAASAALRARDQAGPHLLFQSLTYPGLDGSLPAPRHRSCALLARVRRVRGRHRGSRGRKRGRGKSMRDPTAPCPAER